MFGSLMGDNFDDMFGHMRRMHDTMNSLFGNAFGSNMMFGGDGAHLGVGLPRPTSAALMPFQQPHSASPFPFFGFPNNMNQLMRSVGHNMPNGANCHSFSSSTVVSMTAGPDGKPQVYRASSSTRSAPGGIRETKKTVCDSRTGLKKMAIGRHIGDRSHVKEKERNMYSGDVEENEEYVNLDEEEAPEFNAEWQSRTRQFVSPNMLQSVGYRYPSHRRNDVREYLALPPAPSTEREDQKRKSPPKKKNHRSQPYNKRKAKKEAD